MTQSSTIGFEQLSKYFHLPINDVAKELGICATMLKKICRRNGIPRWPHRKIKSLNKMIENLEATIQGGTSEADDCVKQEINILKNKKNLIMKNPSILASSGSQKRTTIISSDTPKPIKKIKEEPPSSSVSTPTNSSSATSSPTHHTSSSNQITLHHPQSSSPPPPSIHQQHHQQSPLQHHHHIQQQSQQMHPHHQQSQQHAIHHSNNLHHSIETIQTTSQPTLSRINSAPYTQPSTPNFSIHQLLTPASSFNAPLTSYLMGDEDELPVSHEPQSQPQPQYMHMYSQAPPPPHAITPSPQPQVREIEVQHQAPPPGTWYQQANVPTTTTYVTSAPMMISPVTNHMNEFSSFSLPKLNIPESMGQQMAMQQQAQYIQAQYQQPPPPTTTKVVYMKTPTYGMSQGPQMMSHQVNQNNLRWVMENNMENKFYEKQHRK